MTKLDNGITVVTESEKIPSNVHMGKDKLKPGIMMNIGTRDEVNETSGSLLALKNTYYKSLLKTNETIN